MDDKGMDGYTVTTISRIIHDLRWQADQEEARAKTLRRMADNLEAGRNIADGIAHPKVPE